MTKRFKINTYSAYDTTTFTDGEKEYSSIEVVDLLNELNDENEELKFELKECREHKLFSRRQLEKENERLKSELLFKEDLIQQMKIKLSEDYYEKWKKCNLKYIGVCEELLEGNKTYKKLSDENDGLKQQIKELYKFIKCDIDNEIDVYPKSILESLVNILKIIGDVE